MAGIMNNTARQYNIKCVGKKNHRVTVRVAPGFNVVDDEHWEACKNDAYVKLLKKEGKIDFGSKQDDMELERDPDTKAKSKSTPPPLDREKQKIEAEAKLRAEAFGADGTKPPIKPS